MATEYIMGLSIFICQYSIIHLHHIATVYAKYHTVIFARNISKNKVSRKGSRFILENWGAHLQNSSTSIGNFLCRHASYLLHMSNVQEGFDSILFSIVYYFRQKTAEHATNSTNVIPKCHKNTATVFLEATRRNKIHAIVCHALTYATYPLITFY